MTKTAPPPARVGPTYTFDATVLEVHDGDTFRVRVSQGFDFDGAVVWLRMVSCWAAELSQPGGPEARDYLAALIPPGTRVVVRTELVKTRDHSTEFRRSFVRYVATTWRDNPVTGEQENLSALMCAAGHATPYENKGQK